MYCAACDKEITYVGVHTDWPESWVCLSCAEVIAAHYDPEEWNPRPWVRQARMFGASILHDASIVQARDWVRRWKSA